MRAGDLHVPAKDARVAQLQAGDLRLFAEARLEVHHHPLAVTGEQPRLVEVCVEALTDHAAVAGAHRRIVLQRAGEQGVQVVTRVEPRAVAHLEGLARAPVGAALERESERRELAERATERQEIPRPGAIDGELHGQALEIRDVPQARAQLGAEARLGDEQLDGVEAAPDLGDGRARREEAAAQEAGPRRGLRLVDVSEERAARLAIHGAHQLEMALRRLVEEERVTELVAREAGHGERARAPVGGGLAGLGHGHAPRRGATGDAAGARGAPLPRPEERVEDAVRLGLVDGAVVLLAHHHARANLREQARGLPRPRPDEDLARVEANELAHRARQLVGLARGELAGGDVQRRDAPARLAALTTTDLDRDQVVVLARREPRVVEHDPGRDHAHHRAGDDPLHLRGVGHLLADRHLEALLEEALHVRTGGVVRHAGHRDLVLRPLVAARERELQGARRDHGVLVEELVEVPHPEEQKRVGVRVLRGEELTHHGGDGTLTLRFGLRHRSTTP